MTLLRLEPTRQRRATADSELCLRELDYNIWSFDTGEPSGGHSFLASLPTGGGGLPAVSAVRRSGGGGRGASRPRTRPPRPPFSGLLPQSQLICQVSPRPPAGRDGREGALLPSRRVHGSTSKVARDEGVDHATAIRSGHASAERGGDEVVDLRF